MYWRPRGCRRARQVDVPSEGLHEFSVGLLRAKPKLPQPRLAHRHRRLVSPARVRLEINLDGQAATRIVKRFQRKPGASDDLPTAVSQARGKPSPAPLRPDLDCDIPAEPCAFGKLGDMVIPRDCLLVVVFLHGKRWVARGNDPQ